MDGALASVRNKKLRTRDYMSNTVIDALEASGLVYGRDFVYFEGKGGIWRWWDRKLAKFIRKHNVPGNKLICIGKSAGGKDTNDEVKELLKDERQLYSNITLFFVDAEWAFRRESTRMKVPPVQCIYNFYQRKTNVLNGAIVSSPGTPSENIHQELLIGDTNHFNIVDHPKIYKSLLQIFKL
jgi:hypothetical protein